MITFYSTKDKYNCFSNFYKTNINLDGKIWPTSEHYFQAMKFDDPVIQEKIRNASTASQAAKMGRSRSIPIKDNWNSIRDDTMYKVVKAKFTQNKNLRDILLSTGTEDLVEASPYDSYWGWGPKKDGKNMLGKILMIIRDELRSAN